MDIVHFYAKDQLTSCYGNGDIEKNHVFYLKMP